MKKIIIAIDGFSSCGKSTMAKDLAREIQYIYIDSGAMYRAVTLYCLRHRLFLPDGGVDTSSLEKEMNRIRISITMPMLNNWQSFYTEDGSKQKFFTTLINHFVFGLDFTPSDVFYISLGYNCRRANEMKIEGSSHWAGLSAGAGVQIKKFKIGASFAKYHSVGSSLAFNLAIPL